MSTSDTQNILPVEPAQLPGAFERAFNAGDLDALRGLFAPEAVRVIEPGHAQSGEQLWASAERILGNRLPIKVDLRHAYVAGDTALLIIDYVHEGTGPDGTHIRVEGTAADVAERGPDGKWRCLISNPAGTGRI